MFVFIDYQVDSLVFAGVCHERCILCSVDKSPEVAEYRSRHILYHCMEKAATRGMSFVNDVKQGIHSPTVATIVEPKAIFTCLGLHEFLTTISEFAAHVLIWSSMKRSTVEKIV